LSGAALVLFVQRDLGGVVALPSFLRLPERKMSPEQALPVNAWSLRSVYTRGLAMIAMPTLWWTIGIAGFAAFTVVIARQTEKQLADLYQNTPILRDLLTKVGGSDINNNATLLSFFFVFMPVLLMAFAVTQTTRWSSDEEDGRLELVLATPQSRLRVLLGRFAALATATVLIGVLTLALTALASAATGFALDSGHLAAATLSMIPLGLLMAALGYLFAGWLRTAVDTGLLSFLLAIWFFITFVGPELDWPESVKRLSAFYYYGTPLVNGLPLGDMLGVLAVTIAALALASLRFMRKDVGR
jgi:ABC-2 type transport system permease protein